MTSSSRDVALLLQIKNNQLDDVNGRLSNWNESAPNSPCSWTGIRCDRRNQAVDSVDFTSFGIGGGFPADFCRIQTLRTLNLYNNSFEGSISSNSITLCSRISFLNLSSNYFDGNLPEFGLNFVNLIILDLSVNSFTGEFPLSFGLFPAIQALNVGGNLLNGSIPSFLTNLTELTQLQLGYNPYYPSSLPSNIGRLVKLQMIWIPNSNLIGNIPESIGNLVLLKNLDLSNNSISGSIPVTIGGLRNVESIELYENNLSGELPDSFSNLTKLLWFDCSENNLTGKIPESLAGLTLESFNVNDNQLDGIIPDVLSKNPNLIEMKFFNNKFTGSLPVDLGKNSNLEEFDVSGNQLEGSLPPNLCYRKRLNRIIAFNNRLTGNIPELYGDCDSLTSIRIFNNQISGEVPVRFWSFPEIQMLQLHNNQFEGPISPLIASARSLTQLLLSNNRFSGEFPSEICGLTELVVVDISTNQFSGNLPSCITNLTNLQKLDLQINAFNGEIPTNLSSWTELTELNLSNNKLSGLIPATLADLPVLTYLDLSQNTLSGNIPAALTKLKLNKFNLTYNRLEGRIPTGFNNEFFVPSLTGNPRLCGSDLKPIPSCSRSRPISLYLLVGILSILAFILITSLLWIFIKSNKVKVFGRRNSGSWKITTFQRVGFNEDDMLGNLTDVNLIGSGGSGRVYRVKLKTGQTVAVKKLLGVNRQPEMETVFLSEVETLSRIRHGNIVKLLCSCIGEDFRVLVYEYIENGSLGDVLHGEKGGSDLDWAKRYEIAIGSARGLSYLHHDCVPAILHRDVKSNNILLDENFTPRVADFGLAKAFDLEVNDSDCPMMSRVAGSYGYIAPEYGYTMKITEKSDVYSYGVVLLELLTGKRPNDSSFGENSDIVKWVTGTILSMENASGDLNSRRVTDLGRIIDSRMDLTTCNYAEIEKVLNVAILCTSAFPMNRPSMRRVAEMLVKDRQFARPK